MFEDAAADLLDGLDGLDAALRRLAGLDLTRLDPAALASAFQRLEAHSRRRDSLEHGLVAEIDTRGVAFEAGCRSTQAYLQALCNIAPGDAKQRVECAQNLAPGRTLTGEAVPAIFPAVADAEAAGVLSVAHARVIVRTIERLPDAVAAEHDRAIEADLVAHAAHLDPRQLAVAARRTAYLHDQDGVLADEAYRERHRTLTVSQRPDGSAHIDGELTAPCAEALLTVLDSLAAPRPEAEGAKDPRTAGERNHDGLLDGLSRLVADGGLPSAGGVSATILLTITEDQLRQRAGLVRTGHGALISLDQALQIATDAQLVPVVFSKTKEIARYGHAQRLATEGQRLALIARDQGCSFPGCDIPPAWTQAHHITEFHLGGPTTVDNLTLLCGHHHRTFEKQGWTGQMINGQPHWTPPPWIDPAQVPRQNTVHI